jgi:hypothetical protein
MVSNGQQMPGISLLGASALMASYRRIVNEIEAIKPSAGPTE